MKYPVDYDALMEQAKQEGIEESEQIKSFVLLFVRLLNDSYYQGRLDESMNKE